MDAVLMTEHAGQVMAQDGAGKIVTALAVPGRQPVRLAEGIAKGIGGVWPKRGVERNQRAAPRAPITVMSQGNAGCLIAQNDAGESTNAATRGVEGRKAADQVDQQILTQIVQIGGGQAKAAVQAAGGNICLGKNAGELVPGNRRVHRCLPRSSFLMISASVIGAARRWDGRGKGLGELWEQPGQDRSEISAGAGPRR